MKLLFITTCITLFLLFSCTKKKLPTPATSDLVDLQPVTTISVPVASQTLHDDLAFAKTLGSNLKFLASLEKEVLKLILDSSSPEVNQFEVLGYGFDKFNGAKTGFLAGFGCQKIAVRASVKKFEVFSECTKPAKKLAEISEDLTNKNKLTVVFLTSNWKVILGNAAGINPERICEVSLKDNKVQTFECRDTVFSPRITGLDINLYELKIKKYLFNRNQADELVIEGGQFKDMVETKKISLTVPMTGKISIIENEIKVKDDFTDMQNQLLGLEEKKEEVKDAPKEEKSNSSELENVSVSGTSETQKENPEEASPEDQNQQAQPEAPPGEADPNSVPQQEPQPSAPYGR